MGRTLVLVLPPPNWGNVSSRTGRRIGPTEQPALTAEGMTEQEARRAHGRGVGLARLCLDHLCRALMNTKISSLLLSFFLKNSFIYFSENTGSLE